MFFFLVQSEQGDIFKVTLETDDDMVGGFVYILPATECIQRFSFLCVLDCVIGEKRQRPLRWKL